MQGFNMGRYYPPDTENAPRFNTSHPLGARARKLNQGILIVRFELPFAVWCQHCKPPTLIGQGVRFNAEKKKVGNFHSTPIWSFRIKHTACGGWLEIRTDPENTEYVVTEGGVRRDYGPGERVDQGELAFLTPEERERRREDAFAALEGRVGDKLVKDQSKRRVEELYEAQERTWEDPYTMNQRLRKDFRVERKRLEKLEAHKQEIQEKFSLGITIEEEVASDTLKASLVDFGNHGNGADEAARKPLFNTPKSQTGMSDKSFAGSNPKAAILARKTKQDLRENLVNNTRAVLDPFLAKTPSTARPTGIPGLKRKREPSPKDAESSPPSQPEESKPNNPLRLYDSESD